MKKRGEAKKGAGRPRLPKPEPKATLDDSDMMTLQDVADYLNCHYGTVFRLIHHGDLPAFRLGHNWRCLRPDLETWIAAGGGKPPESARARTDGRGRGRKPKPKTMKS
jgi:excisionase family DNA binding protein